MEDGVNYLATEDYEDLIDYEPEDCEKTWRTGRLPAADELTTVDEVEGRRSAADQQIEDSLDDARLEAISRREKELAAELEEIDARLYEIRNLQSGTKVKQRPNKEMTAAETLLREEDRRKEREYFLKEAAGRNSTRRREENQRLGGRVHQGRGGQRKHYWVKEDGKRAMWRNHNLKTWEIGDESDRSYGYGRGIELSGSGLESSKCAVQLYENSKGDSSSFIWKYTPEYGSNWVLMTAQNIKISCLES